MGLTFNTVLFVMMGWSLGGSVGGAVVVAKWDLHTTPAASSFSQSWMPQPSNLHCVRFFSVPMQKRLSIQYLSGGVEEM